MRMKSKPVCIFALLALVGICIRGEVIHRRCRAALVDERTKSQMVAIKTRARDFMEMKLHQQFAPALEAVSFVQRYELRIRVPRETMPEFLDWMKGTSLQPARVEGWPSECGQFETFGTNELVYRVYYGEKPAEWK